MMLEFPRLLSICYEHFPHFNRMASLVPIRKDIMIEDLLMELSDLSTTQRKILITRFCGVIGYYRKRVKYVTVMFNVMRFIVTVGSLLVPALLSIQSPGSFSTLSSDGIYWSTWAVSLSVTMSNGILALYKIDKKYYSLNTVLEQLTSEGWQYLQLSGRYSGFFGDHIHKPTHKNQFVYFCNSIEKIVMRQVEDEYYKVNEGTNSATNSVTTSNNHTHTANQPVNSILPPSPSDILALQTPAPSSAGPVERDSALNNRGKIWLSDAVPDLQMTNNAQKTLSPVGSSVPSTVNITVLAPPLETSPNLTPTDGHKPPQSDVPTIVSHTQ